MLLKSISTFSRKGIASVSLMVSGLLLAQLPYGLKSGQPYKGVTLNILAVTTPQFKGLELRDEEFTALTGIKLNWTYTPFKSLQEKVASVGVARTDEYDVVNYLDSWGSSYANWLVPLDKRMQQDGISMERYPQAFAKSAMYKGEVMGFPLRAHAQILLYRKDIFDRLGLKPPTTWEEVVKVGKIIKAKTKIAPMSCYYGADGSRQNLFVWLNFLWANGGQIFTEDMKPAWTSPQAIEATKDYVALHTKHKICGNGAVSNNEQAARVQFINARSAMVPVWWWAYSSAINPKSSKINKSQVGFVGMPAYNGKTHTYAISMPFSISKYSKQQDAAWEFMKWLSSPELDKRNAIERNVDGTSIINNVVTHTTNLVDDEVNAANSNIQMAAARSLKNSSVMPQIKEWSEIGDLLSNAIQAASNGSDVKKELVKAQKRAKRILRRAGY